MAIVSGNDLKNYQIIDDKGDKVKGDLLAFDEEEKWYQIAKRDTEGKLEKTKDGQQKRLKIYDQGMEVVDVRSRATPKMEMKQEEEKQEAEETEGEEEESKA